MWIEDLIYQQGIRVVPKECVVYGSTRQANTIGYIVVGINPCISKRG
jgi:hypothetical protein